MSRSSRDPAPVRTRRQLVGDVLGLGDGDRRQLVRLLAIERVAVEVYGRARRAEQLTSAEHRLIEHILGQERAHGHALLRVLPRAEAAHAIAPLDTDGLEAALSSAGISVALASLRSAHDWFTLLEELENALQGYYYKALRRLSGAAPATLTARILASEAQHSTLLFRLRHPDDISLAVSEALVEGSAAQR